MYGVVSPRADRLYNPSPSALQRGAKSSVQPCYLGNAASSELSSFALLHCTCCNVVRFLWDLEACDLMATTIGCSWFYHFIAWSENIVFIFVSIWSPVRCQQVYAHIWEVLIWKWAGPVFVRHSSWEADSRPARLFPSLVWTSKVNYRVHKSVTYFRCDSWIQSTASLPISLRYVLLITSSLRLDIPSNLFFSCFPTKKNLRVSHLSQTCNPPLPLWWF